MSEVGHLQTKFEALIKLICWSLPDRGTHTRAAALTVLSAGLSDGDTDMMEKLRLWSATLRGSPSSVTSRAKLSAPHCLERKLYLLILKPHIWLRMVVFILGIPGSTPLAIMAAYGSIYRPSVVFNNDLLPAPQLGAADVPSFFVCSKGRSL
jgi:hypothetical protein